MNDVKSLLGTGGQGSGTRDLMLPSGSLTNTDVAIKAQSRPPGRPSKRPSNMKRELYNILVLQSADRNADISAMVPSNPADQFRAPKLNMSKRRVRKWNLVEFRNEGHPGNNTANPIKLRHWTRADTKVDEPYLFAKFNKSVNIPSYTDEEYINHLTSSKWSKEETDVVFELAHRFDIRWPVLADRYETERTQPSRTWTQRSIEDLKERFYSIVSELNVLHTPPGQEPPQPIAYDADHERRRKDQLIQQFKMTTAEFEEEDRLQDEYRKIEQRRREREKKAADLQKLLNMEQHSPSVSGAHSPVPGKKKVVKSTKLGSVALPVSTPITTEFPREANLRFPVFTTSGVHLRSQEMKLPSNVGHKKMKNIEVVLANLKLDMNPMGADDVVAAYNKFREEIITLQEMKSSLQTAEGELEALRARLMQTGAKDVFEIDPRLRISNIPEGGYDPNAFEGEAGAPTTSRRITSWLDISSQAGLLNTRKRKAVLPPTPMDLKRTRKL